MMNRRSRVKLLAAFVIAPGLAWAGPSPAARAANPSRQADQPPASGKAARPGDAAEAWADAGHAADLPEKILSGYTSFFLNKHSVKEKVRTVLDPMAEAKFTAVTFKIFPRHLDLSPGSKERQKLQALAEAVHKRHLAFLAYVYPSPNGKRDPKQDAALPAFVDADGTRVENRFSLVHWKLWAKMFDNVVALAKVSREMGIAAVRVDLEHIKTHAVSYDDGAWARFAESHPVAAEVPPAKRAGVLKHKHLKKTYHQWYFDQLAGIARRLERKVHAINPDLSLGVMPASLTKPVIRPFVLHMGTPRAPEIVDSWAMYGGRGFTKKILEARKKYKKLNPNLLFIPWFRINRYKPDAIAHQAYHAAMASDGYSNWNMNMLGPRGEHHGRKVYWLPPGTTARQYWAAYRKANEQVRAALARGRTSGKGITFKPVKRLGPPLYLDHLKVPDLQPAGSGEGEPHWLRLRDQQVIYLWARKGERLRVKVRHDRGSSSRKLKYALVNARKKTLARGTVDSGGTKDVSVPAPRTGTYALVVTSGSGGGPWYSIRVHNQHMGVRMHPRAYLMRPDQQAWVARSKPTGKAAVVVTTKKGKETFLVVLDEKTSKEGDHVRLVLPEGRKVSVLGLRKPPDQPSNKYTQDFYIHGDGAIEPFLFDGPNRRLTRGR